MKILITGIGGTIGSVIADALSLRHEVTGIDIRPVDRPGVSVADLTDADQIAPLFKGVDAVVHLAAERRHTPDIGWDLLLPTNVVATANVYDAAHAAGVRRFVFASSMHVMGNYESDEPWASIAAGRYEGLDPETVPLVTGDMPVRPDGRYAATKALGESLGRYYADCEGMEVVCVRLGTVSDGNGLDSDARGFVSWFSHRDLAGFFTACVEAPDIHYKIVYGASANTWKIYDTASGWRALGFTPSDNAENLRRG
ncbi:MAG: NAD(P)-dependent oxidoreductase [Chloroflexi bacterium]|nr:NAD(P)-dependent oxidoreductase [Chloroflexota bacterium]